MGKLDRMKAIILFLLTIILALPAFAQELSSIDTAGNIEVDIEIVLAVDASGSVDRDELRLQLKGIAEAFRDPQIQRTISRGTFQQIAASMVIWSDAAYAKHPTKWFLINSPSSAEKFASVVENFSNRSGALAALSAIGGGGTGLGDGLAYALTMLENNGITALRQIVDISGDGRESTPWNKGAKRLPEARAMAERMAVTVNGLAIEIDLPNLGDYYRRNVIVGPHSFVEPATSFEDYIRAIKKKLLRELSPISIGTNQFPPKFTLINNRKSNKDGDNQILMSNVIK